MTNELKRSIYAIDSRSLAERVADNIERLIKDKNLAPGDKIPNEYELANTLEVGRSTVREAVKLLVSRNVLEVKRGSGTYVCDNPGMVEDPLGMRFEEDEIKAAIDLAKIRLLLEEHLGMEAAEVASEEDIAELKRLADEISELLLAGKDYSEPDSAFHTKLCSISGNSVVPRLVPLVVSGMGTYAKVTKYKPPLNAIEGHKKIIAALEKHDAKRLRRVIHDHIQSGIDTMRELESEK